MVNKNHKKARVGTSISSISKVNNILLAPPKGSDCLPCSVEASLAIKSIDVIQRRAHLIEGGGVQFFPSENFSDGKDAWVFGLSF